MASRHEIEAFERERAARHGQQQPAQRYVTPVRVDDVRMPFLSMVAFMVKWAIASIPALVILFVLLTLLLTLALALLPGMRGLFP